MNRHASAVNAALRARADAAYRLTQALTLRNRTEPPMKLRNDEPPRLTPEQREIALAIFTRTMARPLGVAPPTITGGANQIVFPDPTMATAMAVNAALAFTSNPLTRTTPPIDT